MIAAPLNIAAGVLFAYWIAIEVLVYILTFGRRQLNEAWFSPLTQGQYEIGDFVSFRKGKEKKRAEVIKKTPKQERLRNSYGRHENSTAFKFCFCVCVCVCVCLSCVAMRPVFRVYIYIFFL